jgi:adenine-specific DNA methylase
MTMFPTKAAAGAKAAIQVEHKRATPLGDTCFIESQFPVSKMSKESYTERKAVAGQTLTGLGKWWGRKPLVLCRATILGLLLPATDDPQMDREVFLRLMTMEDDGMLRRKSANIPAKELFRRLPPSERAEWFEKGSTEENAKFKKGLEKEDKEELQRRVFLSMSYDERLDYCVRPEQIDGPTAASWKIINTHLGTAASTIPELVAELGERRFGHTPRVGDSFCGGGSIPFEAARIGCEAFGSDLNPVAALLTWAALNIVGGGPEVAEKVQETQRRVYEAVDRQITEWGIEHREPDPATGRRWRADAYLYCTEATCPECGWRVPMAPTWVIGKGTRTIARLIPDAKHKRFNFEIESGVSEKEMTKAAEAGTTKDSELVCPNCLADPAKKDRARTPIRVIRGDGRGDFGDSKSRLRGWDNRDLQPRADDLFGERLYCVRWVDTWTAGVTKAKGDSVQRTFSQRHYLAPTANDLKREATVLSLLMERFDEWQAKGFIPSRKIEPGAETTRLGRERGWTHWHHLFTPRQLLQNGLLNEASSQLDRTGKLASSLVICRFANWNSRLCQWVPSMGSGGVGATFSNQALNTFFNYPCRAWPSMEGLLVPVRSEWCAKCDVTVCDAKSIQISRDLWITDPPYADAINYEEISEFFLAWVTASLRSTFSEWSTDSRRSLAVKGDSDSFGVAMVDCYRRLAEKMPANGLQVVMFTHQDAGVWADLSLILWAAGLRVTAAWCIATETGPAVGEGNYVQGTVLLILRKQTSTDTAFLDEVYQEVEGEVRRQLDSMKDLDDARDPNFSDTDYQLAAYAAALRVLTSKKIEEIDVAYELTRKRGKGEKSKVEEIIEKAVKIACDHLVPAGIEPHLWKSLSSLERLYVKGLEMESHGEHRQGVYQELARGFGVEEYKHLLASTKANETRLKTATEFGRKELGDAGFGSSLVRHALFATFKTAETDSTRDGITWFKTEVKDYGMNRQRLIELLDYMAALGKNASLEHWHKDAHAAGLLAGALRNRQDNV